MHVIYFLREKFHLPSTTLPATPKPREFRTREQIGVETKTSQNPLIVPSYDSSYKISL
jgi:hypothetical protein